MAILDKNLNSVEKDNILRTLMNIVKRIEVLEKELLKLQKRVQVLEP